MEEYVFRDGRSVFVRRVTIEDFDNVMDFMEKLAAETVFTNQYPKQPRKDKEASRAKYESDDNLFLGVFDGDDKVVGMCSVGIARAGHPWIGRNCDFGIMMLKAYSGQGLGTFLMQKIEAWAKLKHMHRINGRVRAKNRAALGLYLKCGFQIEGHMREMAFINGEWHDEYCIGKILED